MVAILGLLGFCGLTGVVYLLFYRLLWGSAIDEPTATRLSAEGDKLANEENDSSHFVAPSASQVVRDTIISAMSSSTDAPPKNL